MTAIFLSYARVDYEIARIIAAELEGAGIRVWWDEHLAVGDKFSDSIRDQITSATYVLVLWSKAAVQSDWARAEADLGRQQGKLLQLKTEQCELPLPFSQLHFEDISRHMPDRALASSIVKSGPSLLALQEITRIHVLSRFGLVPPTPPPSSRLRMGSMISIMRRRLLAAALALPIAGVTAGGTAYGDFGLLMTLSPPASSGYWWLGLLIVLLVPMLILWKVFTVTYTWFLHSVDH